MASSWADAIGDAPPETETHTAVLSLSSSSSPSSSSRPTRFFYVPPHLRTPLSASAPEYHPVDSSLPSPARRRRRPHHPQRASHSDPDPDPSNLSDNLTSQLDLSDRSGTGINFDAYEDIPVETSGADVPPPVVAFADIDLGDALDHNIKRCRYLRPTPVQKHAIPILMAGRDLMACAQTGSGKTAAFCFPIISAIIRSSQHPHHHRPRAPRGTRTAFPLALILSPTRELSCQIHEEANKFSYQTGVRVVVVYGGTPISNQLRELERGVDILVATPGRLVDLIERVRVSLQAIKYLALDEADRMLDMGFEPQIRKIVDQMDMPLPGARQTMLFSATFPHEIQRLAADFLSNYIFLAVGRVGSSTDLISQRVEYVQEFDKRNYLMDLLHAQRVNGTNKKKGLTLVFVETKRGADSLAHWLCTNGYPATAIHGDRTQPERELALRSFKSGATPIMVATDVAARGLDIPHVAHVINFDLPKDIDDYVHRIGRTGRAGNSGLATAFFSEINQPLAKALTELMKEVNQDIPEWLISYAQSPSYGGGRSRRSGGRFGGHDYRKDSLPRNGNYYSHSYRGSFAGGSSDAVYNSHGYDFGHGPIVTTSAGGSSNAAYNSHGYEFGHGPVVATASAGFSSDPGHNSCDYDFGHGPIVATSSAGGSSDPCHNSCDYEFGYGPIVATGWD